MAGTRTSFSPSQRPLPLPLAQSRRSTWMGDSAEGCSASDTRPSTARFETARSKGSCPLVWASCLAAVAATRNAVGPLASTDDFIEETLFRRALASNAAWAASALSELRRSLSRCLPLSRFCLPSLAAIVLASCSAAAAALKAALLSKASSMLPPMLLLPPSPPPSSPLDASSCEVGTSDAGEKAATFVSTPIT